MEILWDRQLFPEQRSAASTSLELTRRYRSRNVCCRRKQCCGIERDSPPIRSDHEAIRIAQELRKSFAVDAARRDEKRILPLSEIKAFSRSGLWAITVPRTYGGAEVSASTLAEVVALISEADASIGQIPQNHYFMVEVIRWNGTEEQKQFFFERVLNGDRFGNALSERNTKTVADYNTRIAPVGRGFILNGQKFYSTGALFADWIVVVAKDPSDYLRVAFVPKNTPGLE